jgi:hypothetical protein
MARGDSRAPGVRARITPAPVNGGFVEAVEPEHVDGFLELRPVRFRPTGPDDDFSLGHWGFVVEEVAQIDPRLVHFTYPDEAFEEFQISHGDGRVRTERGLKPDARRTVPDSVAYDRMTVLLQAVAKRQQAELETLEEELCALAARVEALEDAR